MRTKKLTVAEEKRRLNKFLEKRNLLTNFNFGRFGKDRKPRKTFKPFFNDSDGEESVSFPTGLISTGDY
jgi:hypothetical protein